MGFHRKFLIVALSIAAIFFAPFTVLAEEEDAMDEEEVLEIAEEVGDAYGICPEFLQAIAYHESRYIPDADGGSCVGLMQISPKWHGERMERLEVDDLTDPYGNMLVAADYLAELFEEWEDPGVVLMKYNGDSRAEECAETGAEISDYAKDILELSAELERKHGK